MSAIAPAVIRQVSVAVQQTMVLAQQQRVEWLLEKYRELPWAKSEYQSKVINKLTAQFHEVETYPALKQKIELFLQQIFVLEFFDSPLYQQLIETVEQLFKPSSFGQEHHPEKNGAVIQPTTILLLDAENIQISPAEEQGLTKLCQYPVQVKIAIANWRALGKRDVELHQRGYHMIHVPPKENSADMKMTAIGSSLFMHYPTAKEILVCSSDSDLSHLCNTLKSQGFNVYSVRRLGETIVVSDSKTGKNTTLAAESLAIMPITEWVSPIKAIIQQEQQTTNLQWISLAQISQQLRNSHGVSLSQIVSIYLPDKRARDFFTEFPQEFVVHQPTDQSEIYITLFKNIAEQAKPGEQSPPTIEPSKPVASQLHQKIKSKKDLEAALVQIVKQLLQETKTEYVSISTLGSTFNQTYGKPVTNFLNELNIENKKYLKFLQSCSSLTLHQKGSIWEAKLSKSCPH